MVSSRGRPRRGAAAPVPDERHRDPNGCEQCERRPSPVTTPLNPGRRFGRRSANRPSGWKGRRDVRPQANPLRTLHLRELRPVAWQLARETGLDYAEHRGGRVEGTARKAVQAGGSKYALIETSREFTLRPWRPVLEKQIGRHVSGIDRGGSISWTIGRGRSRPER